MAREPAALAGGLDLLDRLRLGRVVVHTMLSCVLLTACPSSVSTRGWRCSPSGHSLATRWCQNGVAASCPRYSEPFLTARVRRRVWCREAKVKPGVAPPRRESAHEYRAACHAERREATEAAAAAAAAEPSGGGAGASGEPNDICFWICQPQTPRA